MCLIFLNASRQEMSSINNDLGGKLSTFKNFFRKIVRIFDEVGIFNGLKSHVSRHS